MNTWGWPVGSGSRTGYISDTRRIDSRIGTKIHPINHDKASRYVSRQTADTAQPSWQATRLLHVREEDQCTSAARTRALPVDHRPPATGLHHADDAPPPRLCCTVAICTGTDRFSSESTTSSLCVIYDLYYLGN